MFKTFSTFAILAVLLIAGAQTKPSGSANTKKPAVKSTGSKTTSTVKKPASTATKISFSINGTLQGYANHLIVLSTFKAHSMTLIDSVRTNAEGKFRFKKTIPAKCIAYLQYTKNTAVPLIIENGSAFILDINPMITGLNYEITGTKVEKSQSLYAFIKNFSKLSSELEQMDQQMANEPDAVKKYEQEMVFSIKQQELRASIDDVVNNKSPLESYFVFFNFIPEQEQKTSDIKSILKKMELAKDIKSDYYKDLKTIYDLKKSPEIGELAPDIDLPQANGTNLKLSSLRGKIVLIDFWASWCGPCRAEFPNVKRIYGRFRDKGFEIYGVSLDKDAVSWTSSISSLGLAWKHVSDLKYWSCAPAKVYKVTGIPYTILVGKDGKIIAKNLRGEELERKLEELFP